MWCGVATLTEPWELHVSVTPGSGAGGVKITFHDGDSVTFPIPINQSFSLTQAMGGVPTVDDVVKVEITGGSGGVAMVSALTRPSSVDPFDEDADGGAAESDNYCLTAQASTGDPGHTSAKAAITY